MNWINCGWLLLPANISGKSDYSSEDHSHYGWSTKKWNFLRPDVTKYWTLYGFCRIWMWSSPKFLFSVYMCPYVCVWSYNSTRWCTPLGTHSTVIVVLGVSHCRVASCCAVNYQKSALNKWTCLQNRVCCRDAFYIIHLLMHASHKVFWMGYYRFASHPPSLSVFRLTFFTPYHLKEIVAKCHFVVGTSRENAKINVDAFLTSCVRLIFIIFQEQLI